MPNPQLTPRGARALVGLGDASFDDLDKDKTFDASWQTVQGQMTAEGATSLDITSAKNAFASAYQGLFNQGVGAADALTSSAKYVTGIHTIAGAAESIAGLVGAAAGGAPPLQIAQLFTGTMVGIGIAAGVVTAGAGAAIVGGLAVLTSLLSGLFGSSPGFQIPGCVGQSPVAPAWSAGCMGYYPPNGKTADDMRTMPNSPLWRRFPDPSNDTEGWFIVNGNTVTTADGGSWQSFVSPNSGIRPIDIAFPAYYSLECQAGLPMPDPSNTMATRAREFDQAYFAAWKLNQEYALNGLQAQPDWVVLAHVLRLWNKTHAKDASLTISVGGQVTPYGAACPGGLSYEETLVDALNRHPFSDQDAFASGGVLYYYTGALLSPYQSAGFKGLRLKAPPKPMATGTKVVLVGAGVAAASAAGVGLYAWLTKQAYSAVWSKLWDETGGRAWKSIRR